MSTLPRCGTHLRPRFHRVVFKARTSFYCLLAVLATLHLPAFSQTVDGFNPGANDMIYSFVVQPDGRVVIGGSFHALGGAFRSNVGRVNADGTVDPTFNVAIDGAVNCMVAQPDGKIVLGGDFTTVSGQSHSYIARITADGNLDTNFNASASFSVRALALQRDGALLLGGSFAALNG